MKRFKVMIITIMIGLTVGFSPKASWASGTDVAIGIAAGIIIFMGLTQASSHDSSEYVSPRAQYGNDRQNRDNYRRGYEQKDYGQRNYSRENRNRSDNNYRSTHNNN